MASCYQKEAKANLIEYVIVTLARQLMSDARFLQQVRLNEGATDVAGIVEINLNQLSEAGRVVIAQCFRIPKSFQKWIGFQHPILHSSTPCNMCTATTIKLHQAFRRDDGLWKVPQRKFIKRQPIHLQNLARSVSFCEGCV